MIGLPRLVLLGLLVIETSAPAPAQPITAQPLPPPTGTGTGGTSAVPVVAPSGPAKKPAPRSASAPGHAGSSIKPAHPAAKSTPTRSAPAKSSAAGKPAAAKSPAPAKPGVPAAAPAKPAPAVTAAAAPPRPDPNKGTSTGLSLPRWVSFRADEVNLRTGPGMQYPIDWVYHRRDYPVQVLREFEVWRLIVEQDGTKGWVHQATLTGRRGFAVQTGEPVLRSAPADTADPVARLVTGVVGHIRKCPSGSAWCEVQTGDYRGWLPRTAMYGVSADEVIE